MEHAPAAYRDLLKVVPLANRESYQPCVRSCESGRWHRESMVTLGGTRPLTRQRRWILGTCTKGKGNKGKGQEKGKGKKDNGEAKGNARTDDSCFLDECGVCGKWRHKKAQVPEAEEGPRKQTSSCNSSSSHNGESNPLIRQERRLFLDTRRVCIV